MPDVPVSVPEGLEVLASDRDAFERACRTTWDAPEDWMVTMGRERFTIGGAVVHSPPPAPLNVTAALRPGDVWSWQGLTWRVIALPGHTAAAVGLILEASDATLACFTGDLLRSPGVLVNLYDLESAYNKTRLPILPAVLRRFAAEVHTDLYLPSTGPAIRDGRRVARTLADRIEAHLALVQRGAERRAAQPAPSHRRVGRFEQVQTGVFQFQAPGNAIVLIDKDGHGLMIDPGPCDYPNPNRVRDFENDLVALEQQAGLRVIEQVLITHPHGDHVDMLPLLAQRYPGVRVGAWAPVARVVEHPERYPYACLWPWYGQSCGRFDVNDHLSTKRPFVWRGVRFETVHLPGHMLTHAGYRFEFGGTRYAASGDTIVGDGSVVGVGYVICNHGALAGRAGLITALEAMVSRQVDVNLCGHGLRFADCAQTYRAALAWARQVADSIRPLVADGDLERASARPWYPPIDQVLSEP